MPYGFYISAEGAVAQAARLETIANNLANVDTPGFKRDLALCQARFAEEIAQGTDFPGSRSPNDLGGGVMVLETKTDHSQGPLKNTGSPTDFAVRGGGYFLVRQGEADMLTRAGNFSFTPAGMLVNQDGYPVLSDAGTPIVIDPAQPWQCSPQGVIQQAGVEQPLAMVEPESLGDLAKAGENLFFPLGPVQAVPPGVRSVAQGFIEGSGVKATVEMMEMIETSRAFEANVNLVRAQDQLVGTLVSRVLRG